MPTETEFPRVEIVRSGGILASTSVLARNLDFSEKLSDDAQPRHVDERHSAASRAGT